LRSDSTRNSPCQAGSSNQAGVGGSRPASTVRESVGSRGSSALGSPSVLGLNRQVRQAVAVEAGDEVDVAIELDTAPREVNVPRELAAALASDPQASAAFERMAFTHRKECARWITDAKQEETRKRRIRQALEMIRAGKTRS
jgi:hypothetical protein